MSFLTALFTSALASSTIMLTADEVHTVSGEIIQNGVVIVEDGLISAVGTKDTISVPPDAQQFSGAVLTPGLIDTWTTAGLTGPLNHTEDQDHAEGASPVQPELRAIDAYHSTDALVAWVRSFGVTTINTGPSPGQPVSGRTLVTRTRPAPVDTIALNPDAFVVFTLGEKPKHRFGGDGAKSRMGSAALIRQALQDAQDYARRRRLPAADQPTPDLGHDALVELLEGQRRAIVHAHRAHDLLTALRIADEFSIDIILAGAAEGWLVKDELAAAGFPVLIGPVMARSWGPGEQRNSNFENAAKLHAAGVQIAFMGGFEGYVPKVRVVLWEAAIAAANGLGPVSTLRALTLDAASILGIDDVVGSIEVGKSADLVLYDDDPFEYASHACTVLSQGIVLSDACH